MTLEAQFQETVMKNLKANGFPEKKVSLPLEKMYEVADSKGVNFNNVLDLLTGNGVIVEKTSDKIIFSKAQVNVDEMYSKFKDTDSSDMMSKAQEMMKNMSPEQLAEIQKQFEDMTPEQKEEIMQKGRDMGLV